MPFHETNDTMDLGEHDPIYNNFYGVLKFTREITKYWFEFGNPNSTYKIVNTAS